MLANKIRVNVVNIQHDQMKCLKDLFDLVTLKNVKKKLSKY
jgi:hypothetical protein